MPKTQNRKVMIWLFIFSFVVAFLILFGGYVRLTHSGLSIVEWNPISGVFPPIGEIAWQAEFEKYQQSPEYIKVNSAITLAGFQQIFFVEWLHRLIARLAGFVYAIPVFYFLFKKAIPKKEFGIYIVMGFLFIGQAIMGWLMVASGLVNRPSVSHIRLTLHLLLALALLGTSLWVALGHKYGFQKTDKKVKRSSISKLTLAGFVFLNIQISYGGFTAGMKAGHLSNTWPKMFGAWLPPGLFSSLSNIIQLPQTVFYIHRWFGFIVITLFFIAYLKSRDFALPTEINNAIKSILWVGIIQVFFGVIVVLFNVQISLAMLHQTIAVILFSLMVFTIHRLSEWDNKSI